jgi:acyl-CoA reductase-like NAD-dependent aldehyde dehydrogenase
MFLQFIFGKKITTENPEGADFQTIISAIQTTSQGYLDIKKLSAEKRKSVVSQFAGNESFFNLYRNDCKKNGISEDTVHQEIKKFQEKIQNLLNNSELARPSIGPCLIYASRSSALLRILPVLTALLKGNSVLLLTNENKSELYSDFIEKLITAGLPEKSCNLVSTQNEDSLDTLVEHPALKSIHFTGHQHEASFLRKRVLPVFSKKVKIHCGGRNPTIFTYDADLSQLKDLLNLAFNSHYLAEHRFNRWFVQEKNYESFVSKLNEILASETAPLSAQKNEEKDYDAFLKIQNNSLLKEKNWKSLNDNLFINYDFNNCSPWHQQETLGNFLTITRFKNSTEAIKFANTTSYASAANVISSHADKSKEISAQLNMPHLFHNEVPDMGSLPLIKGSFESGFGNDILDSEFFMY